MRNDFAVFILTNGRANNVITTQTLSRFGYTGKIYYIIDDEDAQADQYYKNFGEQVIMFNKSEAYKRWDSMDNFNDHRTVMYARNESFRIAKELGLKYFAMFEDDYTGIQYRWPEGNVFRAKYFEDFDRLFSDMIDFLECSKVKSVAFCQGGDFIGGGKNGRYKKKLLRKAMNSFFFKVDNPIEFKGTINEDVTAYTSLSQIGDVFLSVSNTCLVPKATQSNDGGMTTIYLDEGTYVKSFYSVIASPSCVKVSMLTSSHKRIHHKVSWENCIPMILNEKYKKHEE